MRRALWITFGLIIITVVLLFANHEHRTDCYAERITGLKLKIDAPIIDWCLDNFRNQTGKYPKNTIELNTFCTELAPGVSPKNLRDQWNNPYRIRYKQDKLQIMTSNAGGDEHRYSNYVILEKELNPSDSE